MGQTASDIDPKVHVLTAAGFSPFGTAGVSRLQHLNKCYCTPVPPALLLCGIIRLPSFSRTMCGAMLSEMAMFHKGKIITSALAIALMGIGVTEGFAKRPLLPLAPSQPVPSIEERLGGQTVDPAISGTWLPLVNGYPGFGPSTQLLLTDGSVVVQDYCSPNWYRLIPDRFGSYINGSWSHVAIGDGQPLSPMIGSGTTPDGYSPVFFASAVLPDGRLIVIGGEYEGEFCNQAESTKGSLYNPQTDTWTAVTPPSGWAEIGDASSVVLGPNKITGILQPWSFMLASGSNPPLAKQQAVATIAPIPSNGVTWTITGAGKADPNYEEGWTLLPNGEVLTVDTENGTNTETFNPSTNLWSSAGNTPVFLGNNLGLSIVPEMGPAVMTGYGLLVQIGANPHTALFNPKTRTWTAGPTFPSSQETPDGPAALLPNGNILVQTDAGQVGPTLFWELGGETLTHPEAATLRPVAQPKCDDPVYSQLPAFISRMLVLPTGEILWNIDECPNVYVPNPNDPATSEVNTAPWHPTIGSISSRTLFRGNTYTLHGKIFNGISQGAMYGDDAQMATNYPMVRIINQSTGHVCYGRAHGFDAGIATGTTTEVDIPPDVTPAPGWALVENPCDPGPSTLFVVANGIPSAGIKVTIK